MCVPLFRSLFSRNTALCMINCNDCRFVCFRTSKRLHSDSDEEMSDPNVTDDVTKHIPSWEADVNKKSTFPTETTDDPLMKIEKEFDLEKAESKDVVISAVKPAR